MIEGLRQLPWLQERIRNDRALVEYLIDCDKCMESNSQIERQGLGCGWEPAPLVQIGVRPWVHPGYTDTLPTVCPGYTTKLPEVVEINRARLHWSKGSIREFCAGEPTDNILRGIEILEGAVNEANCWRPEEKK